MATILTLNGSQVFPAGNQTIKLTRENPYFTQSESYTLDVTLPMDILENRNFFGSIHRIEHGKRMPTMAATLNVDNKPLLSGSAKVTQITEREVKVQLVAGRSEINLLSTEDNVYIDEMEMGAPRYFDVDYSAQTAATSGRITGNNGRSSRSDAYRFEDVDSMERVVLCTHFLAYDETRGERTSRNGVVHSLSEATQPRLNSVFDMVVRQSGFTVLSNFLDAEPWESVFVASAKKTNHVADTLPHWTVKTFLEEYCHFYNCTILTDPIGKTVTVVSNASFFSNARTAVITPVDEYSVEMNEDSPAHSLASDNLEFDLSGSEEHDYDCISEEIRKNAPVLEYSNYEEALAAFRGMDGTRFNYIFKTPFGRYAGWVTSNADGTSQTYFRQIDEFCPLVRDVESDTDTSLRICPVAISEAYEREGDSYNPGNGERTRRSRWTYRAISIENPTGGSVTAPSDTIQSYIEGDSSIKNSEKEDRMQVFFLDSALQESVCTEGPTPGQTEAMLMPFTSIYYKPNTGRPHASWSLSLNPCRAEYYLGQLHQNPYSFNMKAKYCVKFLADEIPDPTHVFIIRNKRFACEKIEAQIDDRGLQPLMTGYFYEML